MISLLIPVYNRDVRDLVTTLSEQLHHIAKGGEIILIDDASASEYQQINRSLEGLQYVQYHVLDKNIGRLQIRHLLAKKANYAWLLFMDSDSAVPSDQYLQQYIDSIQQTNDQVIVGGRIYQQQVPTDCTVRLHWTYGTQRESIYSKRQQHPDGTGFMSNNVLMHQSVFKRFIFDLHWTGYGHEDTWMGIQLDQMQIPVAYIDNPLLHLGLERNDVFLSKTINALQNLVYLNTKADSVLIQKHVKLFRYYTKLKSLHLTGLAKKLFSLNEKRMKANLLSCNPSLKIFDLYRLGLFCVLIDADTKN